MEKKLLQRELFTFLKKHESCKSYIIFLTRKRRIYHKLQVANRLYSFKSMKQLQNFGPVYAETTDEQSHSVPKTRN